MMRASAIRLGPGSASTVCRLLAAVGSEADAACPAGSPQLVIHHAGSLSNEFKTLKTVFTARTGTCVPDIPAGSLDAARQIVANGQAADIFAAADTIPPVAANWTATLTAPGTLIGGSNPFLDPSGYRADLIFQLAAQQAGRPGLYNQLLEHYTTTRTTDAIGTSFDYQITYGSSAYAAYQANPGGYRYAMLPAAVSLSDITQELRYARVSTGVPGLTVPAAAVSFLRLLFSAQGTAVQAQDGPTPLGPPLVTRSDYARLPAPLRTLVTPIP